MDKKYGDLNKCDIIFEGILKQSPPPKSKSFFNFITKCTSVRWRKRYFVLYKSSRPIQSHLLYFKEEPSHDCKNLGNINLTKSINLSVDVGSSVNRSNVFSIQTLDEKGDNIVYYLCAQSPELMNTWVDKIMTILNINNQNNSGASSVLTLYCSPNRNPVKVTPHLNPIYNSNPKLNSVPWSNHGSQEVPCFSFTNLNERSNDNTTSYYNLSPQISHLVPEMLEDPISTDEDVYKYPCENNNLHLYANLDEDEATPSAIMLNGTEARFFPNDLNRFQLKQRDLISSQEYKYPFDDLMFENKNQSINQTDIKLSAFSSKAKSTQEEICNFDFPLPTRIRNESSSSSSSSDISSSSEEFFSNQLLLHKESDINKPVISRTPPSVPKRTNNPELNISLYNKNNIQTETVLPIKTPKSIPSKHESMETYQNSDDASFIVLNYLDAENLLLNNHKQTKFDPFQDHIFINNDTPQFDQNVNTQHSISELKSAEINLIRDASFDYSLEESLPSSLTIKEKIPSVEYREICDARTEALLKLNVRILKNE